MSEPSHVCSSNRAPTKSVHNLTPAEAEAVWKQVFNIPKCLRMPMFHRLYD